MKKDKWAFFNWPDKIKVCGRMVSPNISFSKAGVITRCPGLYKLQYEDGIKVPLAKAIIQGGYFDALCSGTEPEEPLPNPDDILVIKERFKEYKPLIVPGETQKPFQLNLGFGTWIVIGFLDKYPDAIPNAPIIDVKFATKPWDERKHNNNRLQAAIYSKGLGHDWVQFHVANFKKPGIQIFDTWVSQQDLDNAQAFLIEAARKIVSGDRTFTPNTLCDWCDYAKAGHCPEFKEIKGSELDDLDNLDDLD